MFDEFIYPMGVVSKKEIRTMYGFSREMLRQLLNVQYYDDLKGLDYAKNDQKLSPRAFRRFVELYGTPDGKIPDPS